MWRVEIEKLSLILEALEKEKLRLEHELAARAFFGVKLRETDLYIAYLRDMSPGPYVVTDPCPWPKRDKPTLLSLLAIAARHSAAQSVYLRGLFAAKDKQGSFIFPAGRFDILLARRLATPLPSKHPALGKQKVKAKTPPPVIFYEEIEE